MRRRKTMSGVRDHRGRMESDEEELDFSNPRSLFVSIKTKLSANDATKRRTLFSRRRSPKTAGKSSNLPTSTRRSDEQSAAIARGVDILKSIFPKWENDTLLLVLEANGCVMEDTISAILKMEKADDHTVQRANELDGYHIQFPVKKPLPDDFLRLPGYEQAQVTDDDDSKVVEQEHKRKHEEEDGQEDEEEEEEDEDELEDPQQRAEATGECSSLLHENKKYDELEEIQRLDSDVDRSMAENENECRETSAYSLERKFKRSTSFAEDDGTLFGKELGVDGTQAVVVDGIDESLSPPPPVPNVSRASIVSDAMNQKFLPVELRNHRQSIFETTNIDVIKRSKLDLSEAENRIRHREPHLVFECLSKASEIYRQGVISSQELDTLRSMIVVKMQPSKMLIDMTMNMDTTISDHEWHLLILKCKGIRQALSIQIVKQPQQIRSPIASVPHIEYLIRVMDVETGVIWFTRKRFRELYKLHRKLTRLSSRLRTVEFPAKRPRPGRTLSPAILAQDRAPVIENFLRATATLVTPSPMNFLDGCALKQLQQFLDVPTDQILQRNKTQAVVRELRVYVFHTINDATSPEGTACGRFLSKTKAMSAGHGEFTGNCSDLLEEIGMILDSVQEYMLQHRFEEMKAHVMRLLQNMARVQVGFRTCSSASLLNTEDTIGSNDKLQQMVSDAIRHELEDKICVPIMHTLIHLLQPKVSAKEKQFAKRVSQLRNKPQSFFGIPIDKISLSSWSKVVEAIKDIDQAFLPSDKLRKLVHAAHQIHSLYRKEQAEYRQQKREVEQTKPATADDENEVLSGDDFLPIFIYVIVHSELKAPILTQVLLNRLCDPEKRRSEPGYYLATFEAAIHHILSGGVQF